MSDQEVEIDLKILQYILKTTVISTGKGTLNENDCDEFPVIKTETIDRLSKSFTKLLTFKVPKELFQRYQARLHLIDTLRDWSRLQTDWDFGKLPIFQDAEYSSNFLMQLLRRHLTPQVLINCNDVDYLVQVANLVLYLVKNNKSFKSCCANVIERIITLKQSEKSENFLQFLMKKSSDLNIDSGLLEKVYISQKSNLIEKPLADCFVLYCSEPDKQDIFHQIEYLFENIVDSPLLFQIVSDQLKEFFIMSEYAEQTQKFIQIILEKIQIHCDKYNKDTLDLYSSNLQFCVILLRIKPSYHTESSRKQTINSLKQVFLKNYNDALILISHFPEWLPDYLEFFKNAEKFNLEPKSDVESMDVSF